MSVSNPYKNQTLSGDTGLPSCTNQIPSTFFQWRLHSSKFKESFSFQCWILSTRSRIIEDSNSVRCPSTVTGWNTAKDFPSNFACHFWLYILALANNMFRLVVSFFTCIVLFYYLDHSETSFQLVSEWVPPTRVISWYATSKLFWSATSVKCSSAWVFNISPIWITGSFIKGVWEVVAKTFEISGSFSLTMRI